MRGGMGDVVIAPLYETLRARGVEVRFFHELRSLHLDPERSRVVAATVTRQARARGPDPDAYDPLIPVGGVRCWPSKPKWDELEETPGLREVDLESYYSGWEGVETRVLREGDDFDRVILATPIATLPFVARELLDASARWRDAALHVRSVPTISFQLWVKRDLAALGWRRPAPLLSLYEEPLSTWCDMSHLLPVEGWSGPGAPRSLAYFTGAHEGLRDPPPREDRGYPARCHAEARREALAFLRRHVTALWPDAAGADGRALDLDLLVDPEGRTGEARFDAQYWRSNSEPSERCTLALPGSNKHRLRADATGFSNLSVAGDWIDNGIYAACMEGATVGGILAARAITARRLPIIGEELFDLLPGRDRGHSLRET
jgi:uncharacterized protein with NAD-binding domain and iron-sulfur cluster